MILRPLFSAWGLGFPVQGSQGEFGIGCEFWAVFNFIVVLHVTKIPRPL